MPRRHQRQIILSATAHEHTITRKVAAASDAAHSGGVLSLVTLPPHFNVKVVYQNKFND